MRKRYMYVVYNGFGPFSVYSQESVAKRVTLRKNDWIYNQGFRGIVLDNRQYFKYKKMEVITLPNNGRSKKDI